MSKTRENGFKNYVHLKIITYSPVEILYISYVK